MQEANKFCLCLQLTDNDDALSDVRKARAALCQLMSTVYAVFNFFARNWGTCNLTYLDSVVKYFGCWVKHKVFQRHNFWCLPSTQASVVSDLQHVIREVFSKHKIVSFWLRIQLMWRSQSHRQLRILWMNRKRHTRNSKFQFSTKEFFKKNRSCQFVHKFAQN